ncbi:hypothetical protein NPIL_565841 [Nephila pilipes]|uniref:Uncharacterized protein n=1 Tax=Nephila pilipes TaxID=299642 RepID=A0A8X6U030_NEPPI|nr:hypothetical protein NPIL_565841 [Nephila pilipes]
MKPDSRDGDDGMAQDRVLSHSRLIGVGRRRGERSNPAAVAETPSTRQHGIMPRIIVSAQHLTHRRADERWYGVDMELQLKFELLHMNVT